MVLPDVAAWRRSERECAGTASLAVLRRTIGASAVDVGEPDECPARAVLQDTRHLLANPMRDRHTLLATALGGSAVDLAHRSWSKKAPR